MSQNIIETLTSIKNALDNKATPTQFFETIPSLLPILGHKEGKIRDQIGWSTLSKLFRHPHFSIARKLSTIETLLSEDYLFCGIHKGVTADSVKRSFSALSLADLIGADANSDKALEGQILTKTSSVIRNYVILETDYRGLDQELGWVHCLAHAADVFFELGTHPNLPAVEHSKNINALFDKIESIEDNVFRWDEEYRLGRAIAGNAASLSSADFLTDIFTRFEDGFLYTTKARQNFLNTLRAVYLELHWMKSINKDLEYQLEKIIRS